jgi:hypothetical protein
MTEGTIVASGAMKKRVLQPCSRNAADLNDGSEFLCQHGLLDIAGSHWSCCGGIDKDMRECVLDELIDDTCMHDVFTLNYAVHLTTRSC